MTNYEVYEKLYEKLDDLLTRLTVVKTVFDYVREIRTYIEIIMNMKKLIEKEGGNVKVKLFPDRYEVYVRIMPREYSVLSMKDLVNFEQYVNQSIQKHIIDVVDSIIFILKKMIIKISKLGKYIEEIDNLINEIETIKY
ncbi:MAG: hypothetical protein QW607_06085 [Desulfurococcaceae archaeon]